MSRLHTRRRTSHMYRAMSRQSRRPRYVYLMVVPLAAAGTALIALGVKKLVDRRAAQAASPDPLPAARPEPARPSEASPVPR
jgi:hypothetical protein